MQVSIRSDVEALRNSVFGKTGAPFKTLKAAVRWIKQHAYKPPENAGSAERFQRWLSLHRKLRGVSKELEEFDGIAMRHRGPESLILSFPNPGGPMRCHEMVPADSPLRPLKLFAERAAKDTGIIEPLIVNFVLTGQKPYLSRLSLGASYAFGIPRPPEHTFTIRGMHPIRDDFLRAHELFLRESGEGFNALGGAGRPLSESTDAMVAAIIRLGGTPAKDGRIPLAFWKKLSRTPEMRHRKQSPDSLRKRYERLKKRVSPALLRMLRAESEGGD